MYLMAIVVPLAGVSGADPFPKRLACYAAFLPAWFLAGMAWIRAFSPTLDNLELRSAQFAIAAGAALALAAAHRPLVRSAGRIAMPVLIPGRGETAVVAGGALLAFAALAAVPRLVS